MIIKLFTAICLLAFIIAILYAFFSIVLKNPLKILNHILNVIKIPLLGIIIIALTTFFTIIVLYGLIKSESFIFSYELLSNKGSSIGGIGDFFNGLVTPTISLISIIYVYKAFNQQYLANRLLTGFEIEKSFREDLEWLRNNSVEVEKLETEIAGKSFSDLKFYLESPNSSQIRKSLYVINTFDKFYFRLQENKDKGNFSHINDELSMILTSLYLPSFKAIFRSLNAYIINEYEDYQENLDLSKIEVEFLTKFSSIYLKISKSYPDNLFDITFKAVNKFLK